MKKLFVFMMMVIAASAGSLAAQPLAAQEALQPLLNVAQDCEGYSESVAAAGATATEPRSRRPDQVASMTYPPVVAVSCSSDQWCCKHDIGGTGACTKCCQK